MEIVRSIEAMRKVRTSGADTDRWGFVPTMGALHEGHLSLVRMARVQNDHVVVSVFVNPTQFGPHEDFARYPRNEERDVQLAESAGADLVFLPTLEEMYPAGATTTVSVGNLATILEGAERPGHFDGVCTVVAKLFNIVRPDVAYFGQKDAQQVAVIRKMARDLDMDVEVVVGPTVRETGGLALSSRNAYLSPEEKARATALHDALQAGARSLETGGVDVAEKVMLEILLERGVEPGYARAVDPETFGPPEGASPVLLVVAARIGSTRLIDNLLA